MMRLFKRLSLQELPSQGSHSRFRLCAVQLLHLGGSVPFGLSVAQRSRRPPLGTTLRLRRCRGYAQREREYLYCIQLKRAIRGRQYALPELRL
jgi:hypothetical protein